jgi:hypothetical protein
LLGFEVDQAGVPYFLSRNSGGGEAVLNFQGNSWGFVGPQLSSVLPQWCHAVALAISKSGNPMVAYSHEDSNSTLVGSGTIRFENGGWTFDPNQEISGLVYPSSIAINAQQQPMLATFDSRDPDRSMGISVFRLENGIWVPIGGPRFTNKTVQPRDVQLKLDSTGNPYVSFIDENVDRLSVMRYSPVIDRWEYVGLPNILNRLVLSHRLAIGGDGSIFVGVDGSPQGNATVLYYAGGSWQILGAENTIHYADRFSLVLSKSNIPYIGFTDFETGNAVALSFREGRWISLRSSGAVPGLTSGAGNIFLAIADEIPFMALDDGEQGHGVTVSKLSFDP